MLTTGGCMSDGAHPPRTACDWAAFWDDALNRLKLFLEQEARHRPELGRHLDTLSPDGHENGTSSGGTADG